MVQVHRRLLYDDFKGLGEALNEKGQFGEGLIVRGYHYVLLDNYQNSTFYHRTLGQFAVRTASKGTMCTCINLMCYNLFNAAVIKILKQ